MTPIMRFTFLASLMIMAGFLTGCSTLQQPVAANRPQALMFEFVGLPGCSIEKYELKRNGLLLYTYSIGDKRRNRTVISPDEERWTAFYQVIDRLRVWEWRAKYSPQDVDPKMFVDDGMQWTFAIQKAGRIVASRGDNAVPSLENPTKTVADMRTIFFSKKNSLYELRLALARLAGQRTR